MDKTGMQNIFLYGGNAAAMAPAPHSGGDQGHVAIAPNPQQQQQQPVMYAPTDPSAAAMAAYHSNMFGYFNQSQAAAHAHAAAAMAEQRLSGSYNGQQQPLQPQQQQQPYIGYGMPTNPYTTATAAPVATNWMNYGAAMHQQQMPTTADGVSSEYTMAPWSVTSAGVLSKMNPEQEKKKLARKKHKDKPKRPLSAYNIFFKEERARILASIPEKQDNKAEDNVDEEEDADKNKTGRKRKKAHGKIGFENLAKIIGHRWQELKGDKADKYKEAAAKDMKRYKAEMEVFLTKLEEEKKSQEGYYDEEEGGEQQEAYVAEEQQPAEQTEAEQEEEHEAKRAKVDEEAVNTP